MSDSLFSNAGLFFFLAWSVIVVTVSVTAFGRDIYSLLSQVSLRAEKIGTRASHRAAISSLR